MISVAVVGCGGVGRYHALGAMRSQKVHSLVLCDVDQERIEATNFLLESYGFLASNQSVSTVDDLPQEIDLVIVATSARGRLELVKRILSVTKVRFLVLEKIVEQSERRFEEVLELINSSGTRCWVNHARRMSSAYIDFGEAVKMGIPEAVTVSGPSWGLVTSGLHFIDLVEWWTRTPPVRSSWHFSPSNWFESKRLGYYDLDGRLEVEFSSGTTLNLVSRPSAKVAEYQSSLTLTLQLGLESAWFEEISGTSGGVYYGKSVSQGIVEVQSNLTTHLVDELDLSERVDLPTLQECRAAHCLFLTSLSEELLKLGLHDGGRLPVT